MVFVKVRETYDLKTVEDKMTVIAIHTPKPDIIKKNFPGLLMQCRAYRPYSCDVRVACASSLPLDPLGVGTAAGAVAPEDVFNPILYKAMSNYGMSQLEARINAMGTAPDPSIAGVDIVGEQAIVDVDTAVSGDINHFNVYYGLLANTREWKHANPQSGLEMNNLRPLVWEMVYNIGDNAGIDEVDDQFMAPSGATPGYKQTIAACGIRGNAKPMPFINTLAYTFTDAKTSGHSPPGFPVSWDVGIPSNCELRVPYIPVVCGAIIVPPSKLRSLFYRMVVEWTIEFTAIRPISEITNWTDLAAYGASTHYQNYAYEETKKAVTGSSDTILDNDSCMVSSNVNVTKVM